MFNPRDEAIKANVHPHSPIMRRSELIAFMNSLADDLDIMLDHRHKNTTINMGARFNAEQTIGVEAIMVVNSDNGQYLAISNHYPQPVQHYDTRVPARVEVQYFIADTRMTRDKKCTVTKAVTTPTFIYNKTEDRLKLLADIRDHLSGVVVTPSMRIQLIEPVEPVSPSGDTKNFGEVFKEAVDARKAHKAAMVNPITPEKAVLKVLNKDIPAEVKTATKRPVRKVVTKAKAKKK